MGKTLGTNTGSRKIILVSPHGFCAGVERAVAIAQNVLEKHAKPVYCLREIVHNRQVIEELLRRGMVFVGDVTEIPPGATTLFSAHGVSPAVRAAALARNLQVIDATCPFVTKVHLEVREHAARGFTILLIGHRRHDEVVGVAGEAPERVLVLEDERDAGEVTVPDPARVVVLTQTTLSENDTERVMAILRRRFPKLVTPRESDICYATRNRQQAVRALAGKADLVIVLGAENSSNSNRLVEVSRAAGCQARLVSALEQITDVPFTDVRTLGLTAGASTPETLVRAAIAALRRHGFERVEELRVAEEGVRFPLPGTLRD